MPESEFISDQQRKDYIDALITERGYAETRNEPSAIKQIDAELHRVGHKTESKAKKAEKRPAAKPDAETR